MERHSGGAAFAGRPCADGAQSAGGRQAEHFSGETAAKLTEEISRRRTAREAEPEPQSEAPPEAEAESTDYLGLLELPTLSLTLPVAAEWSYPGAETDAVPVQRHGRGGELCHHRP